MSEKGEYVAVIARQPIGMYHEEFTENLLQMGAVVLKQESPDATPLPDDVKKMVHDILEERGLMK